ncbi:TonB-dependent receptor, partial [Steroidobacter sp.]|uniref:TonB-dependent receptor n=1 Tax=Steroidobacter sp. TaxID=1978227 RepID=UPI001A4C53AE
MSLFQRRTVQICAIGTAHLLLTGTSTAQTTTTEQAAAGLENIVVTAQRRTENLQEVPISVTAVTAESLEKSGITSTSELLNVVPGLTMSRAVKGGAPFIRGVGSQDTSAGNETAVATYVDGVYYMDVTGIMFPFNNVKSIEVLKGPQGTLFGRNATGGLINVITRDPQAEPLVEGSVGYGNYSTMETSLYATGGSDTLAADVAVYAVRQDKGYGRNLLTGQDVNLRDEKAVRSKVVWTPTANDRLTFSAEWASNKTDLGVSRNLLPGAYLSGGLTAVGSPYDVGRSGVNPSVPEAETWGSYLRYEHDFDNDITFSILTAVHRNRVRFRYDSD